MFLITLATCSVSHMTHSRVFVRLSLFMNYLCFGNNSTCFVSIISIILYSCVCFVLISSFTGGFLEVHITFFLVSSFSPLCVSQVFLDPDSAETRTACTSELYDITLVQSDLLRAISDPSYFTHRIHVCQENYDRNVQQGAG